jgi:hypothetical protein
VAVASFFALLILIAVCGLLWRMLRDGKRRTSELARAAMGGPVHSARRAPPSHESASPAILLGIVALSVAATAYFTSTSGFYGDDFVNFREIQVEDGLSFRYLLSPTSAHFAPAHKLGDWFLHTVAPMNFSVAQGILLLGFAASILVFHRVLRELFNPTPALVLTLVYGMSMVHVAVQQWWSSGMDRVPATLFTFLSILGYLRFHRSGSHRWLAVSVGAMSVGLLFYVKPIFVPLYLVLLRVLLLEPHEPVRASIAEALRQWRVWALYVVPVALYSVVYVRGYVAGGQLHSPSPATVGPFLVDSWFRVVAPGTFGLYIPQTNDSTATVLAFAAVQLLVVAGVVWTLVRRRSAWRAWLFLAVTVLVNALAVGLTRIGIFGPRQVAYQVLYNVEIVFLVVIAVGAAVLWSGRAGRSPSEPHRTSGSPIGPRAVVASALASYLALSWWGSHQISQADIWPGPTARAYTERVQAFLDGRELLGMRAVFVDGMVPEPVMYPTAGPWTSHSEVFPVVDADVSFEVGSGELFEVTDDGIARPVSFVSDAGGEMAALLGLGVMGFDPAKSEVRDGALCTASGKSSEPVTMDVPAWAGGDQPHVLLHSSSNRRQVMAFITEPLGGGSLSPPRYTWLKGDATEHRNVLTLPEGPLQRLFIVLGPDAEMCLSRIEIGRLTDRN